MSTATGRLYVVATPIGNLSDITERAVETLRSVDLVIAEDTRRTANLLSHFGIDAPVESYHGDSGEAKRQRLIDRIGGGETAALLTDAGTPGISDPGAAFVDAAARAGIPVSPLPGPSAITTALSASGFNADRFVFLGYPPRKSSDREDFFEMALAQPWTVVLFESPHRIIPTVKELAAMASDRPAFLARELTKRFEELTRGALADLAQSVAQFEPRGEYVLVVAGAPERPREELPEAEIEDAITLMAEAGLRTKTMASVLSTLTPLSRNEAYEAALRQSADEE